MGKKNYAVIILVLLIVVAAFAGYKYATDLKQEAKTHGTKIVITPEITRSNIQRGDMYLLPDTLSEEPNPATLPEALKPLIIKEASTTLVKKVEYPDNKKGYEITLGHTGYKLETIMGYYIKFGQGAGWKIQKATYGVGYGIVNLENPTYAVQAESTEVSGDYEISIKVIIK